MSKGLVMTPLEALLIQVLPILLEKAVELIGPDKAGDLLSNNEIRRANAIADLQSEAKYRMMEMNGQKPSAP